MNGSFFSVIMSKEEQSDQKGYPNVSDWKVSRQFFLRSITWASVAMHLPAISSCKSGQEDFGDTTPLNSKQLTTIRALFMVLFPSEGEGPGALDVKADYFLLWVLNDPLLDASENEFIIEKLDQFMEECNKNYNSSFEELDEEDAVEFVEEVAIGWGKSWISRLLTIIFEALFTDPFYGGNPDGVGWKWLEHDPGSPRPGKEITYPNILQRTHEV